MIWRKKSRQSEKKATKKSHTLLQRCERFHLWTWIGTDVNEHAFLILLYFFSLSLFFFDKLSIITRPLDFNQNMFMHRKPNSIHKNYINNNNNDDVKKKRWILILDLIAIEMHKQNTHTLLVLKRKGPKSTSFSKDFLFALYKM